MTDTSNIPTKVARIIAGKANTKIVSMSSRDNLENDLGLDHIDIDEIIEELEEMFEISIADYYDSTKHKTVAHIIHLVLDELSWTSEK